MPTIQVHVKAHSVPQHTVRAHNVKAYTYTRKVKAPAARKAPARKMKAPMRMKAPPKKAPGRKVKRIAEDDLTQEEKDYWGL